MNVSWWRIEWCWYTYLHTFLSAELLSLSRVMRRHGVQFIDWGLHRCRLYSCCCCCCCHSSWWWWWWWRCLLLPWQACFVWHYIMLPALSLLQPRLDIVMLLVAMTWATMHGVSRSEQRSLCCTVHFLLTVLSAHCCAFSVFLKFMLHLFLYNCCCCWQNFYGDIDDKWNCECFLRFYASASLIDGVGGIVFWSCPSIGVYVCARMLGRRHSPTVLLSTSCLCLFCDVSSAISLMLWITVGAITAGLHCHSKNRDRIWQFF